MVTLLMWMFDTTLILFAIAMTLCTVEIVLGHPVAWLDTVFGFDHNSTHVSLFGFQQSVLLEIYSKNPTKNFHD
jgi:multisubunit Na+/H+ antiporter MnhF subunit